MTPQGDVGREASHEKASYEKASYEKGRSPAEGTE